VPNPGLPADLGRPKIGQSPQKEKGGIKNRGNEYSTRKGGALARVKRKKTKLIGGRPAYHPHGGNRDPKRDRGLPAKNIGARQGGPGRSPEKKCYGHVNLKKPGEDKRTPASGAFLKC